MVYSSTKIKSSNTKRRRQRENGKKIIGLISKKQLCTCSTLFCTFLCRCFARLQPTLVASSISHFLTAAKNFHAFLPTKIRLLCFFFISRSSSFSVIHVRVDSKIWSDKKARPCNFYFSLRVREHLPFARKFRRKFPSYGTGNRKNFNRVEPFHLNSLGNFRVFHTNGKRSGWPCDLP